MIDELEQILSRRLSMRDIKCIVNHALSSASYREALLSLAFQDNGREGYNALWCLTHVPLADAPWLLSLQDKIIDRVMTETNQSRLRMELQLLREQEFPVDAIRVDFLDFCLSKINSEADSYAVRCYSLYLALKMCSHFPELLQELEIHLSLLTQQSLSPGMKTARRKVVAEIRKIQSRG